ncbi:D-amino acid dehydrogenase [Emcibacter sp.]|uniref:D-amino acid dehydrogenase n=1 Tax=Emcibacter sp. TaxID=1979954 RepID=UPI002AA71AB5|nr:D-amino acid dehydrogenase [Emcibacter sp.]
MKVVIIGAGLQGVTTAYFLSKAGHDVTVLERRETSGQETSFANGGILTPSMSDPWNAPGCWKEMLTTIGQEDSPLLIRPKALPGMIGWGMKFLANSNPKTYLNTTFNNFILAQYSVQIMHSIRAETGIQYDSSTRGTLKLYSDPELMTRKSVLLEQVSERGLRFQKLSREQVISREPALAIGAGRLAGGFFFPDDESGDAFMFCQALMEETRRLGVKYIFNCTVNSLVTSNHQLLKVITNKEDHTPDGVILATGTFGGQLARQLGTRLPIQPVKGYSLTLPVEGKNIVPKLPVVDDGLHAAITPLGDRIRVAGTAEFAGFDQTLSNARIENLRDILATVYPHLDDRVHRDKGEAWCGFRPMSADGLPLIGKLGSMENVYINAGHGPLGWTMAAGSARLLSDMITGRETEIDLSPYSPDRHKNRRKII